MSDFPTEVGPQDTVVIHVTGVKPGATGRGLPTSVVQQTIKLEDLMAKYGSGSSDPATVDLEELQGLAKEDPAAFTAKWAKIGQSMSAKKSTALPDLVIDAVCNFLTKEHGVVISEEANLEIGAESRIPRPRDSLSSYSRLTARRSKVE